MIKPDDIPHILILNGPNLNMLGQRETGIYGCETLDHIILNLQTEFKGRAVLVAQQSNHEGVLIEELQKASGHYQAIILNAAAFTHTSVGLHDAVRAIDVPVIEVHLSNPYSREAFRHHSYISSVAAGVICGFGAQGYSLAVMAALNICKK